MLLGIGMGLKASSVPIFGAENAPASIRGALVMTWQLWTAFGICIGNSANLALYQIGKNAWRFQLGSACLPAIPLMAFVYMCPESVSPSRVSHNTPHLLIIGCVCRR